MLYSFEGISLSTLFERQKNIIQIQNEQIELLKNHIKWLKNNYKVNTIQNFELILLPLLILCQRLENSFLREEIDNSKFLDQISLLFEGVDNTIYPQYLEYLALEGEEGHETIHDIVDRLRKLILNVKEIV